MKNIIVKSLQLTYLCSGDIILLRYHMKSCLNQDHLPIASRSTLQLIRIGHRAVPLVKNICNTDPDRNCHC